MSGAGSRWFRINLWLHRWTSLIATLPFLILCLTGTVLIFHEEVDYLLGVVPEAKSRGFDASLPLSESVAAVKAAYPDERIMSVGIDPDHHPGVLLVVTAPKLEPGFQAAELRFTDIATGELIGDPEQGITLTGFLLELHAEWFLGPWGELVGALIALLVLVSLLSGMVVYAPYVKRVAFGVLRKGKGARLLQLDLHNFIGAMVLGWALVVTVTGLLLGFNNLAIGVWQITGLSDFRAEADAMMPVDALEPPVNLDKVFEVATATAKPGWQVSSVVFPATEFSSPRHYTVLLVGSEGLEERMFSVAFVDAATGEVPVALDLPLYLKAITLSQPLHFGDYGGLPLKILWTLCTWLTLFITANGAWLWWNRRRRRRPEEVATEVAA